MEGNKVPLCLLLVLHALCVIQGSLATATPYLEPGFQFDYDKPGQPLPVPITSQCERINLKWNRQSNNTGKLPVAPYFLQVFSTSSSTPYIVPAGFGPTFDWEVPFAPNSQYQICMYDINGVSGGCQQRYTVVANATASQPSCQNVTAPAALSVSAKVPTGTLPLFGYIDQCKILSVTPQSGSPPFILTVAPSSHPPFNITSNSMDSISWTVSLPVGYRFFLSLQSADKQMWSNGPIRVGGLGPTTCLAPGTILKSTSTKIVIGSSMGGIAVGLIAGIVAYMLFIRLRPRRKPPSQTYFDHPYLSRDDSTRPLKARTPAASTIGAYTVAPSTLGTTSSVARSSHAYALETPPSTRNIELPPLTPPLEPLRPSRSTGRDRNTTVEPYTVPQSEAGSRSSHIPYPADIKRPLPPSDTPQASGSRDDAESTTSGSTGAQFALHRTPSAASRAPTYVARTPPPPRGRRSRGPTAVIDEAELEFPPQYGNHTADPSLNYAPDLSSGARF